MVKYIIQIAVEEETYRQKPLYYCAADRKDRVLNHPCRSVSRTLHPEIQTKSFEF